MQSLIQAVYHSDSVLPKTPHFHDGHQIIAVVKGTVDFVVNGTTYRAEAGDVALFSRYENHSLRVVSDAYERYVLRIDAAIVNRQSAVYSLLTDRPVGFCNVLHAPHCAERIADLFRQLIDEHQTEHDSAREMEQLLLKQLLILLSRCTAASVAHETDDVVMAIKRQFENDCQCRYTLQSLARQYGVSVSSLSHRFKQVTGVSVMEHLLSCRMAEAKKLLATTDLPIGEVVERCGFSDNSNFSRTFKRLYGISPTDFHIRYRAE